MMVMMLEMLEMLVQGGAPRPTREDTAWDPSWWPRGGSSLPMELVGYAMLVMGSVALVWLGWSYACWVWRRTAPLRLYLRIARELRLSRGQAWWLWRVSRHQGLANPLTLLLSEATLDHHVQQFLQDRPGAHEAVAGPLALVREQLFGEVEGAGAKRGVEGSRGASG